MKAKSSTKYPILLLPQQNLKINVFFFLFYSWAVIYRNYFYIAALPV